MTPPMKKLITRLFAQAAPVDSPVVTQIGHHPNGMLPGALECQLVLKGGYAAAGVLTSTPEDTLRLLSPANKPDGSTIIADHYFDYDDVLTIVVGRDIPSAIVHPKRSGLILG